MVYCGGRCHNKCEVRKTHKLVNPPTHSDRFSTRLFSVVEPCSHEVQYAGMCANCGKDLTQGDYLGNADASRATVAMSHDTLGLTVSYGEAARLERETTKRLIQTSKLSLIVDLDQCVIQTTVDPTVGEWLKDESNPNYAVLQDVQQFRIAEEGPHAPIYYVKPRPNLHQFFTALSKRYEMHIYTMGTKPYARKIASVIDPDGKFFGSRILSRDENGSNTQKSVERLFPVETNMVVIIDDRGDVWQWCPNLIKVNAFEFFVGIGDINSSFLPKLNDKVVPAGKLENSNALSAVASKSVGQSTNMTLVSNAIIDDPSISAAQVDAQTATLEAQVEDRPLAKQQEALVGDAEHSNTRQGLLRNDDEELHYLERTLRELHDRFYKTYNSQIGEVTKERNLAKLKKTRPRARPRGPAADVKTILPDLKRVVLQDVVILFSGLIRSDRDPRCEWQGQLAIQFGARVLDSRSKETPTHVIVGADITPTNLTEKAKLYHTHPWIKVVYLSWLTDCTSRFEHLNEQVYQVDKTLPHVPRPPPTKHTFSRPATEDGISDNESVLTDNGATDRLIDEASKTMDWNGMEGEMQAFLGDISDDSDSSIDSTYSSSYRTQGFIRHKKRARSVQDGSEDGTAVELTDDDALLKSPLSKRRNMAKLRKSGLAHWTRPDSVTSSSDGHESNGGPASPSPTVPSLDDTAAAAPPHDDDNDGSSGSDMDDFANELELQLEQ